jgi:hypothetical protein
MEKVCPVARTSLSEERPENQRVNQSDELEGCAMETHMSPYEF